jgi:hypothetical protein
MMMTEPAINFADFSVFADMYNDTGEKWSICNDENNDLQDYDDALKDYYDAYCSYLVSRKYNIADIKKYRKNTIIDFYIMQNKLDNSLRNDLNNYYSNNIIDTFNKKLDPPPCFFHQARMSQKYQEEQEKRELETDDVAQHYISLKNMYKSVYEGMTMSSANVNNPNYNNQSECEDNESNYDKSREYCDNDEYYNIYDSDYYSEYDYNSEAYSDDCEYNDN